MAPALDSLLRGGATTFAGAGPRLPGSGIDQLPPTESLATSVLTRSQPVLSEAARIAQELKPSAALLPLAADRLDRIVTAATPVFRSVPTLATALRGAAGSVDALARDPASAEEFKVLGSSDLGTLGASAFLGLGAILRTVSTAQFACNVAGPVGSQLRLVAERGRQAAGGWLRFSPILDVPQTFAVVDTLRGPAPQLLPDRGLEPVPGRQRGLYAGPADRQPAADIDPGRQHGSAAGRAGPRSQGGPGPMRRTRHRAHAPAGVTAVLVIAAVLAVTYYAFNEGLPFVHKFTVSAVVQNSVNVRSGDPVRIAGIDVGAVTGVAPAGTPRGSRSR